MFTVDDILPDVERVLGTADTTTLFARINAAVEILSAESDWDPTVGYIDIAATTDRTVTLPRQVEGILAVNLGGRPSIGHDKWFQYHLNGPGNDCRVRDESWTDLGTVVTATDPVSPFQVVATLSTADDNDCALRVYGWDENDRWITSTEDSNVVDGFLVPTVYGSTTPAAQTVKKISRITKADTKGTVTLATTAGDILGIYERNEREPQYRRLRLGSTCSWARIQFKRRSPKLSSGSDLIPLHSHYAVVLMCKALKKFDEDRLEEGDAYQAKAVQLLTKKQLSISPPTGPSIQMADRNLIADRGDRLDY